MSQLTILSVASEIYPLIKTGGLADVAGALPVALRAEDTRMVTLVPGYPAVMAALDVGSEVRSIPFLFGGTARILVGKAGISNSSFSMRPTSMTGPETPIRRQAAPIGPIMPSASRRLERSALP